MDIQRLRNLTTRKLHTSVEDALDDIQKITGDRPFDVQIPVVLDALQPWLREHVTDERFWDGKYDPSHKGDYPLPTMTEIAQDAMFLRYRETTKPKGDPKPSIVIEI